MATEEPHDKALTSVWNIDDVANQSTPASAPTRINRGGNAGEAKAAEAAPAKLPPTTTPKRAVEKVAGGEPVMSSPTGTSARLSPRQTQEPSAEAPGPSPPQRPRRPPAIVFPRGVGYGANLDAGNQLDFTEITTLGTDSREKDERAEEKDAERKRLELEKNKYRRRPLHAAPRLTFFGTLASTFITLLLLSVTTLLVGVPPLYMQTLHTRTVYVGFMIPVLTIVVTVLHYYVTEFPVRQVNLLMLKIALEVEKHNTSMETNMAAVRQLEVARLEEQEQQQQQQQQHRWQQHPGTNADGNGLAHTVNAGMTPLDAMAAARSRRGGSVHSVNLPARPADAVSTPLHARDGSSFLEDRGTLSSHLAAPTPSSREAAALASGIAADVTRQKRWMKRQLERLDELHDKAIHPEVHSQQKLLQYFLSTFFHFQANTMTAWAELVLWITAQPVSGESPAMATSVRTPGLASGTTPLRRRVSSLRVSHASSPASAPLAAQHHRSPQSSTDAFRSPLSLVSPTGLGAASQPPRTSAQGALDTKMRLSLVELDDLTIDPHLMRSAEPAGRGTSRGGVTVLPQFTPLIVDVKPGVPPPRTDAGRASHHAPPADTAVAPEMRRVLAKSLPDKPLQLEEQDETVRVDVTDPSSIPMGSRVAGNRQPSSHPAREDEPREVKKEDRDHAEGGREEEVAVAPHVEPLAQPTQAPLPLSPVAATITLRRGHRFVGDAPWVFFVVHMREEVQKLPRSSSTSTKIPGAGSFVNHSRTLETSRAANERVVAFEALVSPKGNRDNTQLPPFFSHDKRTRKPYSAFFADEMRQKRAALSVLEQVRLDFGYCEVERDPEFANESSSEKGDGDGDDDDDDRPNRSAGDSRVTGDSAGVRSPLRRQETKTAAARSANGVSHLQGTGSNASYELARHPSSTPLASSYVLSWKPFAERPMRLTFLSVLLDSSGRDGAADDGAHAAKKVWLPVLECLIDGILCVLTEATVTLDRSSSDVLGVELHGVSIEDISRSTSQLPTSSASSVSGAPSSSFTPGKGTSQRRNGGKAAAGHGSEPGATPAGADRTGRSATQAPVAHSSARTIGQAVTETVVMSNVPSGDD